MLMLGVCLTTFVIGVSLAWLVCRYNFYMKNIIEWALLLPLALPSYIVAYCYTDFFEYSTGEIFGEVGHIIESPRTVTAVAVTNSIIRVIDEKTVKEKMNKADPVLAAIIRGLSLRIGDANALAEKHE